MVVLEAIASNSYSIGLLKELISINKFDRCASHAVSVSCYYCYMMSRKLIVVENRLDCIHLGLVSSLEVSVEIFPPLNHRHVE